MRKLLKSLPALKRPLRWLVALATCGLLATGPALAEGHGEGRGGGWDHGGGWGHDGGWGGGGPHGAREGRWGDGPATRGYGPPSRGYGPPPRAYEPPREYEPPLAYPPPQAYAPFAGMPVYPHRPPPPGYGVRRGGLIPPQYRGAIVPDYGRHRLRPPPPGFAWVRMGDRYMLVSRSTGQIFAVIGR